MTGESAPKIVAGVDEAGRGPIAGPVVSAAAILSPIQVKTLLSAGLNDSKKLSVRAREDLFLLIRELRVVWRAQAASNRRIDRTNILRSTLWAMECAVLSLPVSPDLVVVDGNVLLPRLPRASQIAVPKADGKVPAVMAASVIAKVLRDKIMMRLHLLYPEYGFDRHKGYPTKRHRGVLDMIGPSPVHRLSFAGCARNARNESFARGGDVPWPTE